MLNPDEVVVKSNEVKRAMNISLPIVALESTVLTHGLPRPQNLQLAHDMERAVREQGATPATIGFVDGHLHIGLSEGELDRLANEREPYKVGPRDFAAVITQGACGGNHCCRDDVRLQTVKSARRAAPHRDEDGEQWRWSWRR